MALRHTRTLPKLYRNNTYTHAYTDTYIHNEQEAQTYKDAAEAAQELMNLDRSADTRTRRHGHETSHELHGMCFKIPE